jgi:hypothetical protein
MSNAQPLVLAAALALMACRESNVETARADPDSGVKISINTDDAATAVSDEEDAGEPGKVEVKLPGGLGAKLDLPGGLGGNAKFDIAGVGLYPGARVGAIAVNAANAGRPGGRAVVNIGFSAPADAAAVADWYERQFAERKVPVERKGERLMGKTSDGDDFTLALTPVASGSTGQLTITDAG